MIPNKLRIGYVIWEGFKVASLEKKIDKNNNNRPYVEVQVHMEHSPYLFPKLHPDNNCGVGFKIALDHMDTIWSDPEDLILTENGKDYIRALLMRGVWHTFHDLVSSGMLKEFNERFKNKKKNQKTGLLEDK